MQYTDSLKHKPNDQFPWLAFMTTMGLIHVHRRCSLVSYLPGTILFIFICIIATRARSSLWARTSDCPFITSLVFRTPRFFFFGGGAYPERPSLHSIINYLILSFKWFCVLYKQNGPIFTCLVFTFILPKYNHRPWKHEQTTDLVQSMPWSSHKTC